MEHYNARIELHTRDDIDDDLIDRLVGYHPAVARSGRGWVEVIVTLPADTLQQATSTALAVVEKAAGVSVVAVEVMTTAEFDARIGFEPEQMTHLVSVSEAARILKLSRQRILQLIDEHKLPSTRIGNAHAIPMAGVSALVKQQGDMAAMAEMQAYSEKHGYLPKKPVQRP